MISVWPAGRLSVCGKKTKTKTQNLATFWDTENMINAKLCAVVVFIELYPFILLLETLIVFQGHSSIKQLLTHLTTGQNDCFFFFF